MISQYNSQVDYKNTSIKQHIINRVSHKLGNMLPVGTPLRVDAYEALDNSIDMFVCRVEIQLFGVDKEFRNKEESERVLEKINIPLTWWDAFKEQYFPSFLLNRFPVNYKSVDITIKKVINNYVTKMCPHVGNDDERVHLSWIVDSDY